MAVQGSQPATPQKQPLEPEKPPRPLWEQHFRRRFGIKWIRSREDAKYLHLADYRNKMLYGAVQAINELRVPDPSGNAVTYKAAMLEMYEMYIQKYRHLLEENPHIVAELEAPYRAEFPDTPAD